MIPRFIKTSPILGRLVELGMQAEERCYDAWHNVDTSANTREFRRESVNFPFQPTRPGRMRAILRALPIEDFSRYVFIDVGSGKGRTLLVAAEFPFRSVIGIELQPQLHEQAVKNLQNGRWLRRGAGHVESVCQNALEYVFPNSPAVIYMFNPFGKQIMQEMMNALAASLARSPRDIILAMFNPEYAFVVDTASSFQFVKDAAGARMYRSHCAAAAAC